MPRGRPRKIVNEAVETAQTDIEAHAEASSAEAHNELQATAEVAHQPKEKRTGRPARTPINGYRDILRVDGQEPGWHYVFVIDNDTYKYEQGGYEFVTHDVTVGDRRINAASQIGSKVSIPGGNGVTLFLMRCPDEVYEEEMALNAQKVDENERALLGKLNTKEDGRYGSVSIGRGNPRGY